MARGRAAWMGSGMSLTWGLQWVAHRVLATALLGDCPCEPLSTPCLFLHCFPEGIHSALANS